MDEDELDPRIQVELEKLNSATDEINRLEIELDEANTTFRLLLNECTRRLKVHSSKHGSSIENARPFYEALEVARKAQQDCQQAAVNFQRANEVHEAAKETVALAESRFMSQQPEWRFDSAWQEMLNHATIKVRDAEKQRAESSTYHGQATARYKDAQEKVQLLEQRLRRSVAKSRPYFEEKQRCNEQLAAQKEAVETLAGKVARVKSEYAESLRHLEAISEEIHRKRGNVKTGGCGVREPGVGAELVYEEERESTCVGDHYNYDAKLNANSLSDATGNKTSGSAKEGPTTRFEDCIDEVAGGEFRQVVGNFQFQANLTDKNPGVNNDACINSDFHQKVNANALRKISFESLHGLHFNPGRDVCHNEVNLEQCFENVPDKRVESVSPSKGPSSFNSQASLGLCPNQADEQQGVCETDNKYDISTELETNWTECSDLCKVEPPGDEQMCCDQLTALKVASENEGAKGENSDVAEAPSETLTGGIDNETVGAQGDGKNNQISVASSSKWKATTDSECSNTSFTRQLDHELSFCDNGHLQKDMCLKLCQDNTRDKEVPDKQGSGLTTM